MLITTSFSEAHCWTGIKYSIARWQPKWARFHEKLYIAPSSTLLKNFKDGKVSKEQYVEEYIKQLNKIKPLLQAFILFELLPTHQRGEDIIFLCWEPEGQFCHRRILAEFLKKEFNLVDSIIEIH